MRVIWHPKRFDGYWANPGDPDNDNRGQEIWELEPTGRGWVLAYHEGVHQYDSRHIRPFDSSLAMDWATAIVIRHTCPNQLGLSVGELIWESLNKEQIPFLHDRSRRVDYDKNIYFIGAMADSTDQPTLRFDLDLSNLHLVVKLILSVGDTQFTEPVLVLESVDLATPGTDPADVVRRAVYELNVYGYPRLCGALCRGGSCRRVLTSPRPGERCYQHRDQDVCVCRVPRSTY